MGRFQPFEISLKNCPLFRLFDQIKLTRNMRVQQDQVAWMQYILQVGNGTLPDDESGRIALIPEILSHGDLIQEIFEGSFNDANLINQRAILCPKNKDVDRVNNSILERMTGSYFFRLDLHCTLFPGETKTYHSADSVDVDEDGHNYYPTEFLNKQTPSNLPPHTLRLKKGAVVMLLRNINVKEGLCNGSRLQVTGFGERILSCTQITGPRKGAEVILGRYDLYSDQGKSTNSVSISYFRSLSTPEETPSLAFSMSIHKA